MNSFSHVRLGTFNEGTLQAAKWLKLQLLCDFEEMRNCLDFLGNFSIFIANSVTEKGEGEIQRSLFLNCYQQYVETLKQGKIPDPASYRTFFSSIFTVTTDPLYCLHTSASKQLIRIIKPVIQLQAHQMDYSHADGKFRAMVFGTDSLLWGIQFSYPQLYQDAETKEVINVMEHEEAPNTQLFKHLQQWVRQNTWPTPFEIEGKLVNVPMRIGKRCFGWINQHPQFQKKGLKVRVNSSWEQSYKST